jgi:polyketide synthase PksJ
MNKSPTKSGIALAALQRIKEEEYWKNKLSGEIEKSIIPPDYPGEKITAIKKQKEYPVEEFDIPPQQQTRILEICHQNDQLLHIFLTTNLVIQLSKYNYPDKSKPDILIAVPIYRQESNQQERPINTLLLLRSPVDDRQTMKQLLKQVHQTLKEAESNQNYPLEILPEKLGLNLPKATDAAFPLFDISILLESIHDPGYLEGFEHSVRISFRHQNNQLKGKIAYQPQKYRNRTIRRVAQTYLQLVGNLLENPDQQISRLEILLPEDKHRIQTEFNSTSKEYPRHHTLASTFLQQAIKIQDKIALAYEAQQVSYIQLYRDAQAQAEELTKKGVKGNELVGIQQPRSIEMWVGIMGILVSGAAYLPIEVKSPLKRQEYILKDSQVKWVLGNPTWNQDTQIRGEPCVHPEIFKNLPEGDSQDLAYAIYTSGSTGTPKGVLIPHQSVINRLNWMQRTYILGDRDVLMQKTPYTFDVSVWELFWWTFSGSSLYLLEQGEEKSPQKIIQAAERARVTRLHFVPTMYQAFLEYLKTTHQQHRLNTLKQVFCSGEALENHHQQEHFKVFTQYPVRLTNLYGPTEATVDVTAYECGIEQTHDTIPIGKPIDNINIIILNHAQQQMPPGIPGELCIAGDGLARGYLNRPQLTADTFFQKKELLGGKTIYQTGDISRYREDGDIQYLGRKDHQVKLRGNRIELGEIENALRQITEVKEAVAVVNEFKKAKPGTFREPEHQDKALCAYMKLEKGIKWENKQDQWTQQLTERLPDYMIPHYFIPIDNMPVTGSGKIDRKALPDPWDIIQQQKNKTNTYNPPRTPLEKTLVKIWKRVLGKKKIGIQDHFFHQGGDSIKIIRIQSQLNRAGFTLEPGEIFRNPTIKQLAPRLQRLNPQKQGQQGIITGNIPLTPIQRAFFQNQQHHRHHYNQAVLLYSKEGFTKEALQQAIQKIMAHHDALRMRYRIDDTHIQQQNTGTETIDTNPITTKEITDTPNNTQQLHQRIEEIQTQLNLETGPLMKTAHFTCPDGERFLMVIHHLVMDAVSWRILLEDLDTHYGQYQRSEKLQLPLKTDSFKTWTEKLTRYVKTENLIQQHTYWKKAEEIPYTCMPDDKEIKQDEVRDEETLRFTLSKEKTRQLQDEAHQAYHTEINDLLLVSLGLALEQETGQTSVKVDMEGHGREPIEEGINITRTIGWFTTLYPVHLEMSHQSDLSQQIKEVKETLRKIPQKGIGYGLLKYLLPQEKKESPNTQEQTHKSRILFNYLGHFDHETTYNNFRVAKEVPGNLRSGQGKREYPLTISGIITGGQLHMILGYNKKQYLRQMIQRLAQTYQQTLEQVIAHCVGRPKSQHTPSDFTYRGITLRELDQYQQDHHIEEIYPLTPMQKGMLFHWHYEENPETYFEQISFRVSGPIQETKVRSSLEKLFERHQALRTMIPLTQEQETIQIVLADRKKEYLFKDLSGYAPQQEGQDLETYLQNYRKRDRQRGFHLEKDVLFRVALFRIAEQEYEFLWSFHHIIMDGWCVGILTTEFFEIYTAQVKGRDNQLPEVTPFREYIQWQDKRSQQEAKTYWQTYLKGYNQLARIPFSKEPDQENRDYQAKEKEMEIPETEAPALENLAAEHHVTLNTLFQVLWGILLSRYNHRKDVVFGVVVSGRPSEIPGIETMVGLFINTIPLRIQYHEKDTLETILKHTQQQAITGEPWHYYPLAHIQTDTGKHQPILDHVLVYENYPIAEQLEEILGIKSPEDTDKELQLLNVDIFEQAHYNLGVRITPTAKKGITLLIQYNAQVYEEAFIHALTGHLHQLIQQLKNTTNQTVEELTLLSTEEKQRVLYECNQTDREVPEQKTLDQLVQEEAEKKGDRLAFISYPESLNRMNKGTQQQITYTLYMNQVRESSEELREGGIKPGTVVALIMREPLPRAIQILAILNVGGLYLPIDYQYPGKRIQYILEDSGVKHVITDKNIRNIRGQANKTPNRKNQTNRKTRSNNAYVIYTSGSTGQPKGVLVTHSSIINTLISRRENYGMTEHHKTLQQFSYAFDGFMTDFFTPILAGAAIVLPADQAKKDIHLIQKMIEQEKVTHLLSTPSLFMQYLQEATADTFRSIQVVTLAGEQWPDQVLKIRNNKNMTFEMAHEYGVTEASVLSTLKRNQHKEKTITIGKPIWNTQIYLLKEKTQTKQEESILQPTAIGEPGEIYISGIGLARGYINKPELTATRFVTRTIDESLHCHLYRTGDMARRRADGSLEYLGRQDQQVKIRGYRIEIPEIENQLKKHPGIKEVNVIPREHPTKGTQLCAYYNQLEEVTALQLRKYLEEYLPTYMIPTHFIKIETFPLTEHGKLDKEALPEPETEQKKEGTLSMTPPANEEQEVIAKIWKEVLQLEHIGIHQHFFDLGGHSIDMMKVNSRLKNLYKREIPMVEMFRYTTIHQLSQYLRKSTAPGTTTTDTTSHSEAKGNLEKTVSGDKDRHPSQSNQPKTIQPIAVIGMAGRFPGARDIYQYWDNLKSGKETITFFTTQELLEEGEEPSLLENPHYVKAWGVLENKDQFDAAFFGYIPTEADVLDPQIRHFHETAWEALENAGYVPTENTGTIGLYAGASNHFLWEAQTHLRRKEHAITGFAKTQLTNKDFLSTRISYKLNLKGPSTTVQTACSTSLVAIHMACQALNSQECTMALAGGVTLTAIKKSGYLYQEGMILSPDGHCRPFDAKAKGTVSGEGVGVVVLKPLDTAIEEGDFIYAIVKGTAMNNDGADKAGYAAPSVEGQAIVIRRAQQLAGVEPETITYVETHGTATPIGDPIEIEALKMAFHTPKKQYCAIGSVKSNIGHLDSAAGVASFIKTSLAIYHRHIPPSLYFEKPNTAIDFKNSPFYVNTRHQQWEQKNQPLRAGVSSFGIGGTNVHIIMEETPSQRKEQPQEVRREYQILRLSAKSKNALEQQIRNLEQYLERGNNVSIPDLAYTLQRGRNSFPWRKYLITTAQSTKDHLKQRLSDQQHPNHTHTFTEATHTEPRIVYLFPGLGNQYEDMGRDLYERETFFRDIMEQGFEFVKKLGTLDLKTQLYPEKPFKEAGEKEKEKEKKIKNQPPKNWDITINQLTIFLVEYALAKMMIHWGLKPEALMGYSFGEYTAAAIAGVLTLEQALDLIIYRGKLIHTLKPGIMLSVPLQKEQLETCIREWKREQQTQGKPGKQEIYLAIDNGPSTVVAGDPETITEFEKSLKKQGLLSMRVNTRYALHTPMMKPILGLYREKINTIPLSKHKIPFISGVTGDWIQQGEATDPEYWVTQLSSTVQYAKGIKQLKTTQETQAQSQTLYLEIGPGNNLSALLSRFTEGEPHHKTLNLIRPSTKKENDQQYLLKRIGTLWLYGKDLDWGAYYAEEKRKRIPLPTYPFETQTYWWDQKSLTQQAPLENQEAPVEGRGESCVRLETTTQEHWTYVPVWHQEHLKPSIENTETEKSETRKTTWLIFKDDTGIGEGMIRKLQEKDQEVMEVIRGQTFSEIYQETRNTTYTMNPAEDNDYKTLYQEMERKGKQLNHILHLWTLDITKQSALQTVEIKNTQFKQSQETGSNSLLRIVQNISYLKASKEKRKIQVTVVTHGTQEVHAQEHMYPENSTLSGLIRVIPQEKPHLQCQLIDIEPPNGHQRETKIKKQVNALYQEIMARKTEPGKDIELVVALRTPQRWVQRYQPIPLELPIKGTIPTRLRQKGVYLITGGLGKIGMQLAQYLAQKVQARMILTTRSPFPATKEEREENPEHHQRIKQIQEMEQQGAEVWVLRADVADLEQMRKVVTLAEESLGKIHGLFHMAGIVHGPTFKGIQEITPKDFQALYQAKVYGLQVLEELFREKELEVCWIMSSIASQLGGIRFASYAAANVFADTKTREINRTLETPWQIINWESMGEQETREQFEGLLNSETPSQVVISVGGNLNHRIKQWIHLEILNPQEHQKKENNNIKDKKELKPRPEIMGPYVPPNTEEEKILTRIWEEFFGYTPIGIEDDFLELGGDSLKAITLISRIKAQKGWDISLTRFFEKPIIQQIASHLELRELEHTAIPTVKPVEKKEYYLLSAAQKRLVVLQQMDRESLAYNDTNVLQMEGPLDIPHMETVFKKLIQRHESLRTRIQILGEEPVQVIQPNEKIAFQIQKIQGLSTQKDESQQREEIEMIQSFIQPFELTHPPFLRVGSLKTDRETHILIIDMHHIITDGVSHDLFIQEFITLYKGENLERLPLQYKDYAEWQRGLKKQGKLKKQEQYWMQQYQQEVPQLELPRDYTPKGSSQYQGETLHFEVEEHQFMKLREITANHDITLFMLLLAVLNLMLSKVTSQEDIVVGTGVAGRKYRELEGIIGLFVNILAIRSYPHREKPFSEYVKEIRESTLNAFDNQDYQFDDLVEKKVKTRSPHRNPLFDVMLLYQNMEIAPLQIPHLQMTPYEYHRRTTKFDLNFISQPLGKELCFSLEYHAGLFKKETVQMMQEHFMNIIGTLCQRQAAGTLSEAPIKEILKQTSIKPQQEEDITRFTDLEEEYKELIWGI